MLTVMDKGEPLPKPNEIIESFSRKLSKLIGPVMIRGDTITETPRTHIDTHTHRTPHRQGFLWSTLFPPIIIWHQRQSTLAIVPVFNISWRSNHSDNVLCLHDMWLGHGLFSFYRYSWHRGGMGGVGGRGKRSSHDERKQYVTDKSLLYQLSGTQREPTKNAMRYYRVP